MTTSMTTTNTDILTVHGNGTTYKLSKSDDRWTFEYEWVNGANPIYSSYEKRTFARGIDAVETMSIHINVAVEHKFLSEEEWNKTVAELGLLLGKLREEELKNG